MTIYSSAKICADTQKLPQLKKGSLSEAPKKKEKEKQTMIKQCARPQALIVKKCKRKVQGVPKLQTAALSRHQEEEETDKSKQAQTEQTHEKHQDQPPPPQARQSQRQKDQKTQEQNDTRQDIKQIAS